MPTINLTKYYAKVEVLLSRDEWTQGYVFSFRISFGLRDN
jgi:hypothetical protein